MASAVVPYLVTGKALTRTGNTGYSGQPTSALFEAGDGRLISLGVVQQHQFEALARLLGREDWISDPRFLTQDLRRQNTASIQTELGAELRKRGGAEWESVMSDAGIPCGLVREVGEAVEMPHLAERGLRLPLQVAGLPDGRDDVSVVNAGFRMVGEGPRVAAPPPRLDADRDAILRWLADDAGQPG
jgi:crotonobetainyl-CoA:carnitine CoA-transferase CaiB-like acyl-CoA transferase